ncbi:MAG: hypothetical protein J6U54_02080 [Clostridiales bacterium]|nr:hypothetical protein [Clostridiales bacterium]
MRKILLDTYGADLGEEEIIKGGIMALNEISDLFVEFYGSEDLIRSTLESSGISSDRYSVYGATDFITNHDNPMEIFRGRNESSMAMALNSLKKDGEALGLISAGNTGALMVGSIARIGLKAGLSAPVLCSLIPNPNTNWTCLLDCGAHLTPSASDLVLFARLGAEYFSAKYDVEAPRVGLLSVGSESSKGNELVLEAHKLLAESDLNFIGNVEGCDVQNGRCNVITTDGFTGNVLLKAIESAGMTCAGMLGDKDPELLSSMHANFNFTELGGAIFLGINRMIIKIHGSSNCKTVLAVAKQLCN